MVSTKLVISQSCQPYRFSLNLNLSVTFSIHPLFYYTSPDMPSLLSLPREIRDIIIELVLSSAREAPRDFAAAEPTRSTSENPGRKPPYQGPFLDVNPVPLAIRTRLSPWYRRLLLGGSKAAKNSTTSASKSNAWTTYACTNLVRFEKPIYISNSFPLLLVNRQLSSETASALARQPLPYELDVVFFNDTELWPT